MSVEGINLANNERALKELQHQLANYAFVEATLAARVIDDQYETNKWVIDGVRDITGLVEVLLDSMPQTEEVKTIIQKLKTLQGIIDPLGEAKA